MNVKSTHNYGKNNNNPDALVHRLVHTLSYTDNQTSDKTDPDKHAGITSTSNVSA